jgi:hypothetical protein
MKEEAAIGSISARMTDLKTGQIYGLICVLRKIKIWVLRSIKL